MKLNTLLAGFAGAMMAVSAQAQSTFWVDDDAPNDPFPGDNTLGDPLEDGSELHPFDAIQEALQAAAINGDTVMVKAGTYFESINLLGKRLELIGEDGAENTIVDALGLQSPCVVAELGEPDDTLIKGLTLKSGVGRDVGIRTIGGGILMLGGAEPTVDSCIIRQCIADNGAGIYMNSSAPLITNTVFFENLATGFTQGGGGIFSQQSNPVVTNSTFARNDGPGGALFSLDGSPRFINCIIYGNTDGVTPSQFAGTGTPIVTDSCVEGGFPGNGNINADPLFVNAVAGNVALSPNSPCIDRGDSSVIATSVFKDVGGGKRAVDDPAAPDRGVAVFGLTVDFGAYEFQVDDCPGGETTCQGDLDGPNMVPDGVIDFFDLIIMLSNWGPCP
jgi:hypothetical protein